MTDEERRDVERATIDALYDGAKKLRHHSIAYSVKQAAKRHMPWWFVERAQLAALAGESKYTWRMTRRLQQYARKEGIG